MDESSKATSFQLKEGEPTSINFNKPVKFRIVFSLGTYIEGTILPNSGFTVCSHGDITEFSIFIDEDSMRRPELVRSWSEDAEATNSDP
jgi:hypothetical protein